MKNRQKQQVAAGTEDSSEVVKKNEELEKALTTLKESAEGLKNQLALAEQKNLHLTSLNSELQKKVDAAESLNAPTVLGINGGMKCRSINMRPVQRERMIEAESEDSEGEDSPLLKRVER